MTPRQKDFLKLIDEMTRIEGLRRFEAMSTFLELAFRALVSATLIGEAWQTNENAYLERLAGFRHKDEIAETCKKALALVVVALEEEGGDFLSEPYMECAANPHAGQFFTPWALCQAMAELTLGDELAEIAKERIVTVSEPACGMGGMCIATANAMKKRGINPATRAHFSLVDIDARCVHGAYIQLTLHGISADVIHGNTMSLETWGGWRTFTAWLHPKRAQARAEAILEGIAAAAEQPPTSQQPLAVSARASLQLSFADL